MTTNVIYVPSSRDEGLVWLLVFAESLNVDLPRLPQRKDGDRERSDSTRSLSQEGVRAFRLRMFNIKKALGLILISTISGV